MTRCLPFTIEGITEERSDVRTFAFDKQTRGIKPGQYVMVWLPGVSKRPFSVSDTSPTMSLTIQHKGMRDPEKGKFTGPLFEKEVGDEVYIEGPKGSNFLDTYQGPAYNRRITIGGGTGIIPLAFLSNHLPEQEQVNLLGFEEQQDIFFANRFENPRIATEDGSYGTHGKVTDMIEDIYLDSEDVIYICGPRPMILAAIDVVKDRVPPENIIYSLENKMRCGVGVCGECQEQGYSVCQDGPVFAYSKLPLRESRDYRGD